MMPPEDRATDRSESILTTGALIEVLAAFRRDTPLRVAIFGQYHLLNTVVSTSDNRAVLAPHFYPEEEA